ncbi:hypothetical protein ACHHV8_23780 [Paenibacillus sp. TAB 01]|uniref:hypothetical protein n=1 Tax=Paenibacillus sp. TAB 01 TaxID=3368988 RepID=UPI0037539EC5
MKHRRKGIRRLVVSHYVLVVLLTLILVESAFIYAVRVYYYNSISSHLSNHAEVSASFYNKFHTNLNVLQLESQLPDIVESFAHGNAELQVLNLEGTILTSTSGFAVREQVHTKDVKFAAQGETGRWIGRNPGTGEPVMAVSTPLQWNGQIIAVLRYTTSLEEVGPGDPHAVRHRSADRLNHSGDRLVDQSGAGQFDCKAYQPDHGGFRADG